MFYEVRKKGSTKQGERYNDKFEAFKNAGSGEEVYEGGTKLITDAPSKAEIAEHKAEEKAAKDAE